MVTTGASATSMGLAAGQSAGASTVSSPADRAAALAQDLKRLSGALLDDLVLRLSRDPQLVSFDPDALNAYVTAFSKVSLEARSVRDRAASLLVEDLSKSTHPRAALSEQAQKILLEIGVQDGPPNPDSMQPRLADSMLTFFSTRSLCPVADLQPLAENVFEHAYPFTEAKGLAAGILLANDPSNATLRTKVAKLAHGTRLGCGDQCLYESVHTAPFAVGLMRSRDISALRIALDAVREDLHGFGFGPPAFQNRGFWRLLGMPRLKAWWNESPTDQVDEDLRTVTYYMNGPLGIGLASEARRNFKAYIAANPARAASLPPGSIEDALATEAKLRGRRGAAVFS